MHTLKCRVRSPTRLHFISQTHHGASFSTGAHFPFFLAFPAADTSSSLPGSFAPRQLFKRGPRSTSSYALFTLPYLSHTSSLRSFFLHILSFSPRAPHGHTQHSLTMPAPPPLPRCSHQPPAAIPPMLCPRSILSLAFVPSSQVWIGTCKQELTNPVGKACTKWYIPAPAAHRGLRYGYGASPLASNVLGRPGNKISPSEKIDGIWLSVIIDYGTRGSCRMTILCKDNWIKTTDCLLFHCSMLEIQQDALAFVSLVYTFYMALAWRDCLLQSQPRQAMMQGAFKALEQLHQGVEPAVESLGALRESQV